MSDREIDRQLVERAQRGDKQAFELLVEKYQRKLARLLSRFIRDPAEVEDVTQEAFIKGLIRLTGDQTALMANERVFAALDAVFRAVQPSTTYD